MNQFIKTEASTHKGATQIVGRKAAGLFLFVSVFAVNSVQADSKQDIADLEAFYWQVFPNGDKPAKAKPLPVSVQHNRKQPKNTRLGVAPVRAYSPPNKKNPVVKPVKKQSSADQLQQYINKLKNTKTATYRPLVIPKLVPSPSKNNKHQKDPELVAFYEAVFGKQAAENTSKRNKAPKNIELQSQVPPQVKKQKKPVATALQDTIKSLKKTNSTPMTIKKVIKKKTTKSILSTKTIKVSDQATLFDYGNDTITKTGSVSKSKLSKKSSINPEVELQSLIDTNKTSVINKEKKSPRNPQKIKSLTTDIVEKHVDDESAEEELQTGKVNDLNSLFAKAFGKKRAASVPTNVTVDLKINKTKLGDVTVFSNKQGAMNKVGTKKLLPLLNEVLKEKTYEKVKKSLLTKKKVSFYALNKLGVKARYNPVDLSLDLSVNTKLRKPLILSMGSKRKASVREENKLLADEVSAYLNMYTNVGLISGKGNKPEVNMKLEGSLNVGQAVLESTVDLRGGKISSKKATLIYDIPEKLQRFSLGNVSTGNKNFQENLRLYGVRVGKEFFMDPDLQIRPKANESFVLNSDSDIEVFINNQLRQRFYLRAGIYSLEDIGLYDGANNILVRIKDEFGKVTTKTSQQYYDSRLLKKNLSLYAITVGYLSNKQAGANNKLIKDPIISGYYQKGLSKELTIGFDAQISKNSYLLGSEIITSIPFGSIKSSFSVSGGEDKETGAATRFEFKPSRNHEKISLDTLRQDMLTLENSTHDFLNNWSLSGELRSRSFSLLNGSDSIDLETGKSKKKLKARLQTNFSLDLSNEWRGTLNLGVSDYYDQTASASANLTATKRFNNGMSLSLGARYDSEDDYSMNLQLSIPLFREKGQRKKDLDIIANSKNNSFESKLSIKPSSIIGKNSFAGSLEHIQNEKSRQQKLNVYYRNNNFETNLKARHRFSNKNKEGSEQLNVGFNTSLACVGNNCAISYPIEDSFALVSGPSNQESPIAINDGNGAFTYSDGNETGLPDSYTALIPNNNRSGVVRLDSYRFQNINIDESTLPDGYDSEKTEFEVFPRYHQGFLIKAGGEPSTILNGILVNEDGKELAYKGGQWSPISGKGKVVAFFSNKAGRFRVNSIPSGDYKLELFDYPDMNVINVAVPDLKGKVHDLGKLIIKE